MTNLVVDAKTAEQVAQRQIDNLDKKVGLCTNKHSNTVRLYIANGTESCFILKQITGWNSVTLIAAVL